MKRVVASTEPNAVVVGGGLLASLLGLTLHISIVLENPALAGAYLSTNWWQGVVQVLGGELQPRDGELVAMLPLTGPLLLSLALLGGSVLIAAWRLKQRQPLDGWQSFSIVGGRIAAWGLWGASWGYLWLIASLQNWTGLLQLLASLESFTLPLTVAGCLHTIIWVGPRASAATADAAPVSGWRPTWILSALVAAYVVVFVSMNWGLWFNLRLPHGDSAMYEEHLWNLEHGRGFRSELDQGLFLGEHIQVIHVALVPLHLLWPSHLLLEFAQSLALALATVPIYRITLRHTSSQTAGYLLAATYLCWFGVHFLDIAIDLKTFRPIAFGIPLMLWWLDALETERWKTSLVLLCSVLACKEDYAIVTAPVGLWLAIHAWRMELRPRERRFKIIFGIAHAALITLYLALVVKVFIPYFRHGETVHYAAYFHQLGSTPQEILQTLLTRPLKVLGMFVTLNATLYLACLLVPLAGLPLRSPGRLLTGGPLFLTLCLNELVQSTPGPFYHFHAPLIPILFWSAAAGLGHGSLFQRFARGGLPHTPPVVTGELATRRAGLALCCSVMTAAIFSISPLGVQFWDAGRGFHWRALYIPDERARQFAKVLPLIPSTARVASTDFVHPRFTHCERSYDYSDYPRAVANYEDRVPHDTTHIVLDTQHPYSRIRRLDDPDNPIRELIREPEKWEVLPDETGGYFIVLRRIAE